MLRHKKLILGVVCLAVLLGSVPLHSWGEVFHADTAHASSLISGPNIATSGDNKKSMCENLFELVSWGLNMVMFIGFFALLELEALLDPNAYFDSMGFGGHQVLNDIWVVSRNIVNIIFAFLLIAGAVVTIIKGEGTVIKTYARQFILAVILVNFSWFFPRVILDVATISTATVYSLPNFIDSGPCVTTDPFSNTITTTGCVILDQYFIFPKPGECGTQADGWHKPFGKDNIFCYKTAPLSDDANNPYAILNGVVVNFARFPWLNQVVARNVATTSETEECMEFMLTAFLGLIIAVGTAFPILAMLVVFLVRIPVLWMTIAFMPFMFIGVVLGDRAKIDGRGPMEIFKLFLQAAFIPALVGIPISIGFIMLRALGNPANVPTTGVFGKLATNQSIILAGVHNLSALLWLLMATAVMWIGSFTILQSFKITSGVVSGIRAAGKSAMTFTAKLPAAIPFIPTGVDAEGNARPAASILSATGGVLNAIRDPNKMLIGNDGILGNDDNAKAGLDAVNKASAGAGGTSPAREPAKFKANAENNTTVGRGGISDYNTRIERIVNNANVRIDSTNKDDDLLRQMRNILQANGADHTKVTGRQIQKMHEAIREGSNAGRDLNLDRANELAELIRRL